MPEPIEPVERDLPTCQASVRNALYAASFDAAAAQDAEQRKDHAAACLSLAQALALIDPSVQPAAAQPGDQSPTRPKSVPASSSTPPRST